MTEHELKYMIDGEQAFDRCRKALEEMCGACSIRLQTNYYYDTPGWELHKAGVTLRVRQNRGRLQGQVKRHDRGLSANSEESYFSVAELPKYLIFEGKKAKLLGALTTQRYCFEWRGCEIDLDANHYLGSTDYELEIEYPDGGIAAATEISASLAASVLLIPGRGGKYSRFLKALKKCSKLSLDAGGDNTGKGDRPPSEAESYSALSGELSELK